MEDELARLGLSGYEARALARLIVGGPQSAPDLARATGIPFGRIYDTLHALADRQLVAVGAGRPRTYMAAQASSIAARLLASERKRLEREERSLTQDAAHLEARLRQHGATSAGPPLYGVRMGQAAAREFLIEATLGATRTIAASLALDTLDEEDLRLFAAFEKAVREGVTTRVLLRRQDVATIAQSPHAHELLARMMPFLGQNLAVRFAAEDSASFAVLDHARVVLGIRNPLDPKAYFAVVHLDDKEFAHDLGDKFETLWRKARFEDKFVKATLARHGIKARWRTRQVQTRVA